MAYYPRNNRDHQLVLEGEFKQTDKSDLVVFEIPWGPITLACIVTIPPEGTTRAPVYVKLRLGRNNSAGRRPQGGRHQEPSGRENPPEIRYQVGVSNEA